MKKLLLGTTALVGASVIATSAMAMPIQSQSEQGTPILTASIVAQFEMGIADNDTNAASANTRDGGFVNGRFAEVFFNGELTADNGLVYGARIHIATGGPTTTAGFPGREYMYLQGGWGSVNLGNWIGADSLMNLCPVCNTYYGYGGIDTPFKSYAINPASDPGGIGGPGFRDYGANANWFNYGNKVTYITPSVMGIQGAVSYMPESASPPPNSPFINNDGTFEDVILLGAQYNGDFGDVSVAVSVVSAIGNGDNTTAFGGTLGVTDNIDNTGIGTLEFGAIVRYAGFHIGGNYWDDGSTGALKNRDYGFESTGWTIDLGYKTGPFAIEFQYVDTHRAGSSRLLNAASANSLLSTGILTLAGAPATVAAPNASNTTEEYDFTGIAASLGYDVAPGLKWYGEVIHFDYDHKAAAVLAASAVPSGDNSGIALITGLVLSF